MSYAHGDHSFKFGADLNFDRIFNFFSGLFSGQFTFGSYAAFALNTPSGFTQNFPGAGRTFLGERQIQLGVRFKF
jgi:hypothetical protein